MSVRDGISRNVKLGILVASIAAVMAVMAVVLSLPGHGSGDATGDSLADEALKIGDLPSGWDVLCAYQAGYQGTMPVNVSECGGMSFTCNGSAKETVIVNLFRFNTSADAESHLAYVQAAVTRKDLQVREVSIGWEGMIFERDDGLMGHGLEIVCRQGTNVVFVQYYISAGNPLEEKVSSIAQTQVDLFG